MRPQDDDIEHHHIGIVLFLPAFIGYYVRLRRPQALLFTLRLCKMSDLLLGWAPGTFSKMPHSPSC